ncbi:MAG: hypothetical protein IJI54_06830 [Kiritimatiellae bacterium]|nr:hypothetical protein [Kiritimatiellia bacterium]
MICKKAMKIAMGVGMVLCATTSFAAVEQGFESASVGAINISGWSGDGIVTNVAPTYNKSVGAPIATTSNPSVNTLLVEGEVICSNSGSGTSSVSDFLIYIPELSDELGTDELAGAKVAIAAGTELSDGKIPLMLYCTNNNEAAWVKISTVESNTWLRVTLVFENNRCRVSLDGEPVVNTFGYAASSGDATGGPWYNLANVPEGTDRNIASLSFIGCAKLDDVVIKDSFAENAFPATAVATLTGKNEEVSYNNLNKWGMTSGEIVDNWDTVLNQSSGMTVGQKIACGYDLNSATKFEPVSITKSAANQATIKFPIESAAELGRYKVVLDGGKADGKNEVGGATDAGGGLAAINLADLVYDSNSTVIKFTLKAEKPSAE